MAVGLISANTLVTATDWWNPLSQLANTVEANLATETTNRAAADTSINNRLNSTIASSGISDLPAFKTAQDGYARGWMGEVKRTAADTTVANTELVMETLTLNLTLNRRYRVLWDCAYSTSTAVTPFPLFQFRYAAGASVTSAGTSIKARSPDARTTVNSFTMVATFLGPSTAQYTIGVTAFRTSGTLTVAYGAGINDRLFLIEDMGT